MDVVIEHEQRVLGVIVDVGGTYSYGYRLVAKAGGGGGGIRIGWIVQLWTSFRTESRGWWRWISLWVESTVMDLVSYRKQGVVGVDLALGGKYSYGRGLLGRAVSGGGGSGFGWRVQ